MDFIKQHQEQFDKTIDHLIHELSGLRTGRATPMLVEDISVEAYGTRQQIKAVASITVADAKTINIEPWDKGLLQPVEIAIRNSNLGINPVNDGKLIRLPLPELTEERRVELLKVLNQKMEQAKIGIRKIRENIRDTIAKAQKAKDISEDDTYTAEDELDKKVKEYNEKIKQIVHKKEIGITKV